MWNIRRQLREDIEYAVAYVCLELRGEVSVGNTHLEVVNIEMLFEAWV